MLLLRWIHALVNSALPISIFNNVMKRRVSRYTSDFIRTTMAMAIWSWERVTSRITSASSLSIHQWLYLLRGRFTDLTNCATISLSLSLSFPITWRNYYRRRINPLNITRSARILESLYFFFII